MCNDSYFMDLQENIALIKYLKLKKFHLQWKIRRFEQTRYTTIWILV